MVDYRATDHSPIFETRHVMDTVPCPAVGCPGCNWSHSAVVETHYFIDGVQVPQSEYTQRLEVFLGVRSE